MFSYVQFITKSLSVLNGPNSEMRLDVGLFDYVTYRPIGKASYTVVIGYVRLSKFSEPITVRSLETYSDSATATQAFRDGKVNFLATVDYATLALVQAINIKAMPYMFDQGRDSLEKVMR